MEDKEELVTKALESFKQVLEIMNTEDKLSLALTIIKSFKSENKQLQERIVTLKDTQIKQLRIIADKDKLLDNIRTEFNKVDLYLLEKAGLNVKGIINLFPKEDVNGKE
jgi:hypothetical protein